MQRFGAIILYYRPFVVWSFAVNIGLTIVNPNIIPALITKLCLTLFIWYLQTETRAKRKLTFYRNLGISSFILFFTLYIVDSIIMITYLILVKEFI